MHQRQIGIGDDLMLVNGWYNGAAQRNHEVVLASIAGVRHASAVLAPGLRGTPEGRQNDEGEQA
jgi:hypothetical protein